MCKRVSLRAVFVETEGFICIILAMVFGANFV